MSMTIQEQERKKKKKGLEETVTEYQARVNEIDEKYLKLVEKADNTKKQHIINYAKELETELDMRSICKHVTEKLKDFAHAAYIRKCLDDKYKNESAQRAGEPRRANTKRCPHCHLLPNEDPHIDSNGDSDIIWQIKPSEFREQDINSYNITTLRGILHAYAPAIKKVIKSRSEEH